MKKLFFYISLYIICLTFAEAREISGTIINKSSLEVVPGCDISLTLSDNTEYRTISDLSGRFIFKNLSGGTGKLSVKRIGFNPLELEIGFFSDTTLYLYIVPAVLQTETVNITATRTEVTLQKTPSSISSINEDEINNRSVQTFDEVLDKISGITVYRTSGINVSSLSIRGSSDVAGGGIGNRVLLLLDGRPSLTGDSKGALWSLIPVNVIERTEVVKGAFSSLYGSSAIGGVVNVITKKPSYKPFTKINIGGGFYERLPDNFRFTDRTLYYRNIDLLHSNTINKFSYLADISYKKNDGYAQQNNYEFISGLGKFTYDLFSNRDLELTLQYTNSNSGYPHYWKKDGSEIQPYRIQDFYIGDKIKKETQSIDINYYAIPSSKIRYTSRFYYYKLKSTSEYNPQNPVTLAYGIPGEVFSNFITSYNFGNVTQTDLNFGKHYLIAGTDVQWNLVRSAPESILYGDQQLYNLGAFVQDQIKLIEGSENNTILASNAALRIDYNKFIGASETFQLSPKLSLLFTPETDNGIFRDISYRILAGRAFRAPSIAELYFKKELFGGFDFIYNPNLKPEEMYSLEIGIRKQYDNRFNFDIAAFFNIYNNLIQYVNISPSPLGPFQVQNIAKSQIRGIETTIDYGHFIKVGKENLNYHFDFGYTYTDAKDLSANRKDDLLPYKPKHIFSFSTTIQIYGFTLSTTGRYVSDIEKVIFYKYEEPKHFFVMDAKLSKTIDRYNVYFAIENIFNKFYQELERMPTPNRNFNAGVSVEF